MKKIIFNDDEQKDIIKMYLNFIPINQIREKYSVSKKPIYDVLKDNDIVLHGEKTKFSSVEEMKIIKEYLNNKSASCLSKENNVTTDTILKLLRRNNIAIRNREESLFKYHCNEHYFDEINTYEKAYTCGLLWADGCNKRDRNIISITLQESDKQILEIINNLMDSTYPIHFNDNTKRSCKNTYTLEIKSKHMSEQLEKMGMIQNKSLTLEFPIWLDKELYSSFLLGVLDGDGHISHQKNKYGVIYVCSSKFCECFSSILSDMNINHKIYECGKTGLTKSLHIIRKNDCKIFLDWLYSKCPIYLTRKYNIYKEKYINNSLSE